MIKRLKIGEDIKVFLKGESPWGVIIKIIDKTHIEARINNHLVNTQEHGASYGDVGLLL